MESQLGNDSDLRRELARLQLPLDRDARNDLHATVNAFVDLAKRQGWPPERVIVAVKRLALDAGLEPSLVSTVKRPLTTNDALLAEIVGWCIDRYYSNA